MTSVTEFNIHLKELMTVLIGLPMVVLSGIATHHTMLWHDDCKQLSASHRDRMDTLHAQQVCNCIYISCQVLCDMECHYVLCGVCVCVCVCVYARMYVHTCVCVCMRA